MVRKNQNEYTTISVKKTTKKKLKNLKEYPRETDEETLLNLIQKEVKK